MQTLLVLSLILSAAPTFAAETVRHHCVIPIGANLARHAQLVLPQGSDGRSGKVRLLDGGITARNKSFDQLNFRIFDDKVRTLGQGEDFVFIAVGKDSLGESRTMRFELTALDDDGLRLSGTVTTSGKTRMKEQVDCRNSRLKAD